MVVNIPVYVEGSKGVECVAIVNVPWNIRITSEDWEKVHSTNNGINMNNRHDAVPVVVKIRFNNPHTIVRVWVVVGFAKIVNKCT